MSTSVRALSAEDLWNMPDHGGHNELVDGELRPTTPAGFDHGLTGGRIGHLLGAHVLGNRLGQVVAAETGFIVARNPDTVLAPDVAFVSKARLTPGVRHVSYFDGAPDLAVEVVSPWDRLNEVREKAQRFLKHGTKLVWIVDPQSRSVEVHCPNEDPQSLTEQDWLEAGDLLPGFRCQVIDFFCDVDG